MVHEKDAIPPLSAELRMARGASNSSAKLEALTVLLDLQTRVLR
jgi:hypothetical protein